jgi:LEA14-like dessication related protein
MRYLFLLLSLSLCLSGCNPVAKFETPTVRLANLKVLERDGFEQRFALGLIVENPNKIALPIEGLQYRVQINGHDLFRGQRGALPQIRARGETYLELDVSANLISAGSLLLGLLAENNPRLDYALDANFELTGLLPDFAVKEQGSVNLSQ